MVPAQLNIRSCQTDVGFLVRGVHIYSKVKPLLSVLELANRILTKTDIMNAAYVLWVDFDT